LAAALGTVIGAAVHCLQDAVDGSGIAADAVQWQKRWADEAARIANNAPHNEDYYHRYQETLATATSSSFATVQTFLSQGEHFPQNYELHLRLHNDDVHTFEEVIDALHGPRHVGRMRNANGNLEPGANQPLVALRDQANEMTHRVDSEGQVTVRSFNNITGAVRGFKRLKSPGLQAAVVSTAQDELEQRARSLCQWLSEISSAHPAAQALIVQALVQADNDCHLAGVPTWHTSKMIPPWSGVTVPIGANEIEHCRARFRAFPPHLPSSYLTREEAELLHGIALTTTPTNPLIGARNPFLELTSTVADFYTGVPYRLPSNRYRKSPHALWGTLPSNYSDPSPLTSKHPLLEQLSAILQHQQPSNQFFLGPNRLTESVYVVDTDLRKQQEGEKLVLSIYPHKLPGLHMISGIGIVRLKNLDSPR
jgi:hypothetical protein